MESKLTANAVIAKYREMPVDQIVEESPINMAAELVILTAYLWNAGQLIRESEKAMNTKWRELRLLAETDKQADRALKLEPEYEDYFNAKEAQKVVLETIRSIKKLLSVKSDEARNVY